MTGPKNCATRADSKPPSSLDAPIRIKLTTEIWPSMALGVRVINSVLRMTTLMLSNALKTMRSSATNSEILHYIVIVTMTMKKIGCW